jgi:hypothetical protein
MISLAIREIDEVIPETAAALGTSTVSGTCGPRLLYSRKSDVPRGEKASVTTAY